MSNSLIDDVKALIEEADRTPGADVDNDLRQVGRSLNLFTTNSAELRVRLDEYQQPEVWLKLGPGNSAEFEKHLDEIDRLLHNFLAAAYTLAEHTQKVRNKQADEAFDVEYEEHSPFDEPVCQLIKRLRSDAQHAHLPVVQQRVSVGRHADRSVACRLILGTSYLESLDLNIETRKYVLAQSGELALQDIVDTYARHVEEFVAWFVGAVVKLRAKDLAKTVLLRRRAHELAKPLRRGLERD